MAVMYEALPTTPAPTPSQPDRRVYDDQIVTWFADHGLDPNAVSSRFTLEHDGTLTFTRWLLDDDGNRYLEPPPPGRRRGVIEAGDRLASEQVTVTPSRPLPTDLLTVVAG